jgi:hypothetical protein
MTSRATPWLIAFALLGLAAKAEAAPLERALSTVSDREIAQAEALASELGADERNWVQAYVQKRMRSPRTALDTSSIDRDVTHAYTDAVRRIRVRVVLSLILMGDIAGALREYARKTDANMRQFSRPIVEKLDKLSLARARVIRKFATTKPPRAYGGSDPQQAARAQDKAARYTQWVQLSTQVMNELQNTERELMDALQTMHRDLEDFWQSYASLRDQVFRTNERVMTTR